MPADGSSDTVNVFLSYKFGSADSFVRYVAYFLSKQPTLDVAFFPDSERAGLLPDQLKAAIRRADRFVLFMSDSPGSIQRSEVEFAVNHFDADLSALHVVRLPDALDDLRDPFGMETAVVRALLSIKVSDSSPAEALSCAERLVQQMGLRWVGVDGLPIGYPFAYEKDIIEEFARGHGHLAGERIAQGCPESWPRIAKEPAEQPNPISPEEIGPYQEEEGQILVDARAQYQGPIPQEVTDPAETEHLTFSEARPRARLRYPLPGQNNLTIGIVVSGGIAPGINAVVDGIVGRHDQYCRKWNDNHPRSHPYNLRILGYREGLKALIRSGETYNILTHEGVTSQADTGGSIISTSRADKFVDPDPLVREQALRDAVDGLRRDAVRILYVIGGDGSMRAAHAIQTYAARMRCDLAVVAIPKTMDNDILWVWQSFGFLSAVETAREFVRQLYTEVRANPRLCITQLFGSDSGFVVSHTALASGVCDLALIPEVPFTMSSICKLIGDKLRRRLWSHDGSTPYGLIVMAETAIPQDVEDYLSHTYIELERDERSAVTEFIRNGRRVQGQTPDALRTGGLKIVSRVLQHEIQQSTGDDNYWRDFRVFTNEPRHLVRAITPSVGDVIFGQRLGTLAVDNAMAGYRDFMISQWLTEYVLVPLPLVVLGRKRVPRNGIFWKSVIASTGQPDDLCKLN